MSNTETIPYTIKNVYTQTPDRPPHGAVTRKNENLQKHIILVILGLREYQNRIQHVHKSVHAKYELCSCQERRVMTSLRQNRYLRIQGRMQFFRICIVYRVFEKGFGNLFLI